MHTKNRFLQGIFPFAGAGIDKPAPVDASLRLSRTAAASPSNDAVAASCSEGRDMSRRSVRNIRPYMPGRACA